MVDLIYTPTNSVLAFPFLYNLCDHSVLKSQKITDAEDIIDKNEDLYTVGETINQFNHYGRQYGNSSKT